VFLHLIYFNMNLNVPLEDELITAINKTEKYFTDSRNLDTGFLFINTSENNALVPVDGENGSMPNRVIADRMLLGRLFQKLADHGNRHRYILCDLAFDTPSPQDSFFSAQLNRLSRIILPAHADYETGEITRPLFGKKWALADYVTFEGKVSKIMLYSRKDRQKTLPLVMYEECNGSPSGISLTGLWSSNSYIPFSIYPRYYFNDESIKQYEMRLDEVVHMLDLNDRIFYENILKGRIIVIGNFANDIHVTAVGFMSGSLVLFNSYLTLEAKYHMYPWSWLLYSLTCFCALSYWELFYKKEKKETAWHAVLRFFGLTGFCIVLSLLSDFVFRIHTTVIPVIIYFQVILLCSRLFKFK
jgi:hypothetical protein